MSFSNPTPTEIIEFFERNPSLRRCLFPTVKDSRSGSIRPGYPKGGFDPRCQSMTPEGVAKLAQVLDLDKPHTWMTIPGFTSSTEDQHQIMGEVVGGALKPIGCEVLAFDFDFPIAQMPDLYRTVMGQRGAIKVRGNRERVTLIFRQSAGLIASNTTDKNKFVLVHKDNSDWKVEISVREGASNNLFGLHKSGMQYETDLPEIVEALDVKAFVALRDSIVGAGFMLPVSSSSVGANRQSIYDVFDSDAFGSLRILGSTLKLFCRGRGVTINFNPVSMLPNQIVECISGRLQYQVGHGWKTTNAGITDGFRRDTSWQVFTDLATLEVSLDELEIPYEPEIFDRIVMLYACNVAKDTSVIPFMLRGRMVRGVKWSTEYIMAEWESFRSDPTRHTIRTDNITAFTNTIRHVFNETVRNDPKYVTAVRERQKVS